MYTWHVFGQYFEVQEYEHRQCSTPFVLTGLDASPVPCLLYPSVHALLGCNVFLMDGTVPELQCRSAESAGIVKSTIMIKQYERFYEALTK